MSTCSICHDGSRDLIDFFSFIVKQGDGLLVLQAYGIAFRGKAVEQAFIKGFQCFRAFKDDIFLDRLAEDPVIRMNKGKNVRVLQVIASALRDKKGITFRDSDRG